MADYRLQARIPQETATKLFEVIKELQENSVIADITVSNVVRTSLDNFINEREEDNNGIKTIKFDLDKCNDEELKIIQEMTTKLCRIQELSGKNKTKFYKQLATVNTETYKIEIDKIKRGEK